MVITSVYKFPQNLEYNFTSCRAFDNMKQLRSFKKIQKKCYMSCPTLPQKTDYISRLPNEMLIHIFSFLSVKDLTIVRRVCRRWFVVTACPTLWKYIYADNNVPSDIICQWLRRSPLLKKLTLRYLVDVNNELEVNTIISHVSRYNKKIESIDIGRSRDMISNIWHCNKKTQPINMYYAWNRQMIKSKPLCLLMKNCKLLRFIRFNGIKIKSYNFFALLNKRECDTRYTNCLYNGPVSVKQRKIWKGVTTL